MHLGHMKTAGQNGCWTKSLHTFLDLKAHSGKERKKEMYIQKSVILSVLLFHSVAV